MAAVPRGRLALVLGLMLLAALTEGLGLVLLVQVLGTVGGAAAFPAAGGVLGSWVTEAGVAPLLGLVVALVGLRALVLYHSGIEAQRLGFAMVDGLRSRCMRLLLGADWRVLSAMRQSDNASLLITDIDRTQDAYNALMAALASGILLAGAGLTALALSPRLALLMAIGCGVTLLAYRSLRRRAKSLGERLSAAYEQVYARIDENLGALRLIKMLAAETRATARLDDGYTDLRAAELAYTRSFGKGQAALQISAAAVLALSVWLAVDRFGVAGSVVVPLVALFARAVPLLSRFQESWQNWLYAVPSIAATQALIIRLEAAAEPAPDPAVPPPQLFRALTLTKVSLRHDGREAAALQDVSLEIPACKTLALTGPSGAGKSTLADLVCGLSAPDSGTVTIDGQPLMAAQRRAWRGAVSYVQQDPVLFHATIRENLAWAAPDADDAAMRSALGAAAADFVFALPDGLDTVVGDRGARLSGGERQRIALARALLSRPQLLVLDEATSALDEENEAAIARAVAALAGQMTIIVICHRGALAALADCVVRLEAGRVVAVTARQPDSAVS